MGGFTVTRLGIQRNGNVSHTSDRRFRNEPSLVVESVLLSELYSEPQQLLCKQLGWRLLTEIIHQAREEIMTISW